MDPHQIILYTTLFYTAAITVGVFVVIFDIMTSYAFAQAIQQDCNQFSMEKETVRYKMAIVGDKTSSVQNTWQSVLGTGILVCIGCAIYLGYLWKSKGLFTSFPLAEVVLLVCGVVVCIISMSIVWTVATRLSKYAAEYHGMMTIAAKTLLPRTKLPSNVADRIEYRVNQEFNYPLRDILVAKKKRATSEKWLYYYLCYHMDNSDVMDMLRPELIEDYLYPPGEKTTIKGKKKKNATKQEIQDQQEQTNLKVVRQMQILDAVGTNPEKMDRQVHNLAYAMNSCKLIFIPLGIVLFLSLCLLNQSNMKTTKVIFIPASVLLFIVVSVMLSSVSMV